MDKTSFRKKARARLRRITDKAASHCGHDELVAQLVNAENDFVEWVIEQMEVERVKVDAEARHDERMLIKIATSPG